MLDWKLWLGFGLTTRITLISMCLSAIHAVAIYTGSFSLGAEPKQEGDWLHVRDEQSGDLVATMQLKIHPQAEPLPVFKYRLLADEFSLQDGNAALYYLKAMGYLEQEYRRNELHSFREKARQQAQQAGEDVAGYPPYSWLNMPIAELPVEEVKKYLQLTEFQRPFLADAARQKNFSLDRHIREVESPVSYLLPEIQTMRELARKQSLRCRVATAEGQAEEALEILGQQFAMAHHLGQDEFLVSALVGAAVSSIATTDALQLIQLNGAPNLYWALAALPDPLIDMRAANAFERQFLYQQVKVLQEVDETPRSPAYWQDFIDRLIPQVRGLDMEGLSLSYHQKPDHPLDRAAVTGFIAAAYPGAKRYLLDTWEMDPQTVAAYPTAQVVFLAAVKIHRVAVDEYFKWNHVPIWQANQNDDYLGLDNWLGNEFNKLGWASVPAGAFLTAFNAARTAQYRVQQSIALLQTVEAIRMYAAEHAGDLPSSLERLSVPAPMDPFTGKPIDYEYNRFNAVLTASRLPGIRYRLIIQMAQE